jgi:HSP20 family protein
MTDTTNIPIEMHENREPPESYFLPATDIYETADELVLTVDLPAVRPEGLSVTVEDNVLFIRAQPAQAQAAPGEVLLQEFTTGEFYRAFQLPADYETGNVRATLKQGVLTLKLPKSERMKPRRIPVRAE